MNIEQIKILAKATKSFPYFIENIFPMGFSRGWTKAPHLSRWAEEMQTNNLTARLCARKHLKSTLLYAFVMWKLIRAVEIPCEILYASYNTTMAGYHIGKIRKLMDTNPYFAEVNHLTDSSTSIQCEWDSRYAGGINVTPVGIMTFKRGRHPDVLLCDDVLADPKTELSTAVIELTNRVFFEDMISLPVEGGELHLAGTPQDPRDLFFQIKDRAKNFYWVSEPAIINELTQTVVWPELFPFDKLMQLRTTLGPRSFKKEYMCSPVMSENAFFTIEELTPVIDKTIGNRDTPIMKNSNIVGGFDIGKRQHPSHFTAFEEIPDGQEVKYVQIYQVFWDGVDYSTQVELIRTLIRKLGIDTVYYDNTRAELEALSEQGLIPSQMIPLSMSAKMKMILATTLERVVQEKKIVLQNDQRMLDVMMQVNNELQAVETNLGHGDSFWSAAFAMHGLALPDDFRVIGKLNWGELVTSTQGAGWFR